MIERIKIEKYVTKIDVESTFESALELKNVSLSWILDTW